MKDDCYLEVSIGCRKVKIYRKRNSVSNGYDYYLSVFSIGAFGVWYINDSFKQNKSISSEKDAIKTANEFLSTP